MSTTTYENGKNKWTDKSKNAMTTNAFNKLQIKSQITHSFYRSKNTYQMKTYR